MQIPFFTKLQTANNILIAGAGGGYDIICGVPLYFYLRSLGKTVTLANWSFSELQWTHNQLRMPYLYEITKDSDNVAYFPEKHLLDWLSLRGENPRIYGIEKTGVQSLADIYSYIVCENSIDTVILVDGGTDSLMFGDEEHVGTIVEDACSILAVNEVLRKQPLNAFVSALGFGVERDVSHYACLENMSTLTRSGDNLGSFSITCDMPEGTAYIELINYLNKVGHQPSIVSNNVKSAMLGEFGDFHSTIRAKKSEQFISVLMNIYWNFSLQGIADQIVFKDEVINSHTIDEFIEGFVKYRSENTRRKSKKYLPIT